MSSIGEDDGEGLGSSIGVVDLSSTTKFELEAHQFTTTETEPSPKPMTLSKSDSAIGSSSFDCCDEDLSNISVASLPDDDVDHSNSPEDFLDDPVELINSSQEHPDYSSACSALAGCSELVDDSSPITSTMTATRSAAGSANRYDNLRPVHEWTCFACKAAADSTAERGSVFSDSGKHRIPQGAVASNSSSHICQCEVEAGTDSADETGIRAELRIDSCANAEEDDAKMVSEDGASAEVSTFDKWDSRNWPAWFERLFIDTVAPGACFDNLVDESKTYPGKECVPTTMQENLSSSEFNCSCCFELMVEPTTIQCGHSFCRLCLANWYYGSNRKRTCPQCRLSWNGYPRTNVLLRNTIRVLFPAEVSAREAEAAAAEDAAAAETLRRFEDDASIAGGGLLSLLVLHFSPTTLRGFLNALLVGAVAVFIVGHLPWQRDESLGTVTKPVPEWSVDDVAAFLRGLGPWAQDYGAVFAANAIDGQLIMALSDRDLQERPFRVAPRYHRRALLSALAAARAHGSKPPADLWEYNAANPGTALLLLWGLKTIPRHTILGYMVFFAYDSILVPFVHITCPSSTAVESSAGGARNEERESFFRRLDPIFWELQPFRRKALIFQSLLSFKQDSESPHLHRPLQTPSLGQWIEFVTKVLLLPHFLVAEFAWDWLNVHYWTTVIILLDCLFLSALEIVHLRLLCQRNFAQFFNPNSTVIQEICLILGACAIWRYVPTVICDVTFYILIYFVPLLRIIRCVFKISRIFVRTWYANF